MKRSRRLLQSLSIALIISITLPIPLSGMVVYAQDPSGTTPDDTTDLDIDHDFPPITAADLPSISDASLGSDPETPLTHTFVQTTEYIVFDGNPVASDMIDNPFLTVLEPSSGLVSDGFYILPNPIDLASLGALSTNPGETDAGYIPAGRPTAAEAEGIPEDPSEPAATTIDPATAVAAYKTAGISRNTPAFTGYVESVNNSLRSFISSDIRLAISQTDKTAITGENHGDCTTWNQADDDFFVNGFCDPPRVSTEIIRTLNYLLTPKDQGGAGREYIKVDHIIDYQDHSREEGDPEQASYNSLNGPHKIDTTIEPISVTDDSGVTRYMFDGSQQNAFSHAVDISAIDRIRITTRIQKKGIFSTSTSYRFNTPIPIKVAWQSDEGISHEPLPNISTDQLVSQLGAQSILDLLGESDALDDPSFAGRPLESIGIGDIARFLGGRLLSQLLAGQDIGRFNFGDTIKDFGILAVAGALNLDPDVVRNAHNLEELEELTGRSWVGQQIELPEPITGQTLSEILANIGQQRLGELLGVKGYALTNYNSVDEFKIRLGQGLLEERLPVPEHSFEGSTRDEVRNAVGAGRFDLIFTADQASEIDERLGIEVGPTASFISNGDITNYKRVLGADLFDRTIGKYNVSQGDQATPLHPYQLYEQLMGNGSIVRGNGAQGIGTLAQVRDTVNELVAQNTTFGTSLTASLPETLAAGDTNGMTRQQFLDNMRALQEHINAVINYLQPYSQIPGNNCKGQQGAAGHGYACSVTTAGDKYYTTPEAAINARNAFERDFGSMQLRLMDAIDIANNTVFGIQTTSASSWSLHGQNTSNPGLSGLTASLTAAVSQTDPLSNFSLSLPKTSSFLATSDLAGGVLPGDPEKAAAGISSELKSALQAMQTYMGTYGSGNAVGYQSANRRDQYYGFPAGTLYSAIGGQAEEIAFADIGVWTLSQRLTNTDEQVAFRNAVNNARLRSIDSGTPEFATSSAQQQYLADIFLTVHPADEFRRIGRRLLVDQIKNSAEANSVVSQAQNLAVVQDILFYTQRLQVITSGIETIRQAAVDLHNGAGDEVSSLASQLNSVLNPADYGGVTSTGIQRTVRETKNLLSQLRHSVEDGTSLTQINTRILPALRNIERATMEILEGEALSYQSGIPSDLSLRTNTQQVGGSCDAPNDDLYSIASTVLGSNNVTNIFGGDDLITGAITSAVLTGGSNLDDTLRYIGSAKLGDLLELPQATFDTYLGPGIDRGNVNDFFYSVGVGYFIARCGETGSKTRDELITEGKNYIARVSIPALANKLGITMPDWLQPEDIAGLILGNPTDVLFGIGARQVEERLGFPSGFVRAVVMPEGNTEAERQHNRERSIIEAALLKFNIELDLPLGFTLTDNPVESMGEARAEQVLNLPSGTFYYDPNEMYPDSREALIGHLTTYYTDQYTRTGVDSSVVSALATASAWERFANAFGIGLPSGGRDAQHDAYAAYSAWSSSDAGSRGAKAAALIQAEGNYTTALRDAVTRVFTNQQPEGWDYDDQSHQDAVNRQQFFIARIHYLDSTLGIPAETGTSLGATQKWLTGDASMNTTNYIRAVGSGTAEEFAANALVAGLRRLGIQGHWFDVISQPSNISLIRSVFTGSTAPNPTQWSQLFTMFSNIFSVNLDEELNFDGGTFAQVIAHPSFADEILVDQGIRIFSDQVLGINLSSQEYDRSINIKRVVQAAIYGAALNPATGRFEAVTFENGLQLHGDLAVVYALGEVNDMALQYLTTTIRGESGAGDDLWRFLRVPITTIHDVFEGRLETMGMRANYIQEATAARQSWDDHVSDPTALNQVRSTAESHRLTAAASGFQPSFGGQNTNDNMWQDLGSFIGTGHTIAPTGATQAPALINAQATATSTGVDQPVSSAANPGLGSYYPTTTSAAGNNAATNHIQAADTRQRTIDMQRASVKDLTTYMVKELGYAAMDFGIEKLFDFPSGVIAPGIARALIEGNPQQRMNAIFYIGAKYALQELDVPDWLRPFADINTLNQAASFIFNLDNSQASVQAAFQPGGLFSKVQTAVFPHGLFGEINLPDGTFGAIVGFMITGSTDDFHVGSANFQGLGNLFNTQSLLRIGFDFAEKWLDIDAGTLMQAYNNVYQMYKAYDAYQAFSSISGTAQGVISLASTNAEVAQILQNEVANVAVELGELPVEQLQDIAAANLADSGNQTVQAAQQAKSAQLQANLIQAGVTLALFAINQLFGKAINKFESALGLPPGTIMQLVGLGATAAIQLIIVGSLGPMFWIGLGVFALMTILGFGVVKIRVYATADGYYPFVGKLGDNTLASPDGQPPYAQWPSADLLNDNGTLRETSLTGVQCATTTPTGPDTRAVTERPADCQLGWFDPRNKDAQKENFQLAARVKVMGLVRDLYAKEYSSGVVANNDRIQWSTNDYPTLVVLDTINEGSENNYYLGASNPFLQPAKLAFNRAFWLKADEDGYTTVDQTGDITCNASGAQWGICSSDGFWKAVHIQW